jgi:opacity protein-like surface antigen
MVGLANMSTSTTKQAIRQLNRIAVSGNRWGWAAGAGVDYALSQRVSLRARVPACRFWDRGKNYRWAHE